MSRIGRLAVPIPGGVEVKQDAGAMKVKGPKGELKFVVNDDVLVKMEDGLIAVEPRDQPRDVARVGVRVERVDRFTHAGEVRLALGVR